MRNSLMRHSWIKSRALFLTAFPAVLFACGDSTSPQLSVVGSYEAVVFATTPSGGTPRDELQAGSTFTITLNSDGSTSGHLFVAANGTTPALNADMAGTWTRNGNSVSFTQTADTFVRNMTFAVQRVDTNVAVLLGDKVFSGT
ncbi:MAG: hypothetical protein ABJB95_05140, partial [Gemmatimonadales bacterium]